MESFVDHLRFLENKAAYLRLELLQMLHRARSGNLGGSLSVMEILVMLYYGKLDGEMVLRFDPAKPGSEEQDYFVLSKGHASPALYTVLADCGFFKKEELDHFRQINSLLQAYPFVKIPGVTASAGAPGYGLTAAVGLAMALKMERKPNYVVCLVGDGELQEGQLWEAVLVANQYKLDNLTLMIDFNGLQMDGLVRGVLDVEPVVEKFESFGWKNVPIASGHDFEGLLLGLERAKETQRRPTVLVCPTVKGKGVPFVENKAFYHSMVLSDEELKEAIPYLKMKTSGYTFDRISA